jgi:Abnormal spindle-like microcephaly-assoc'd, ASPM-SPD-2-Hydin/Protein of unknown function (DUF1573)
MFAAAFSASAGFLALAAPPGMTVGPSPYDYAQRCVGSSAVAPFTITNEGSSDLMIDSITRSGSSSSIDFTAPSVPSPNPIPPGGTAAFSVTFKPSARGLRQAFFTVNSSAGQQTIDVYGTGVDRKLAATPASVSFGDQRVGTRSTQRSIVVSNPGKDPVTVTGVARKGTNAGEFVVTTPAAPFVIQPGATTTIAVAFQPAAVGLRSGAVELSSNACGAAKLTVPLVGTGAIPNVVVDPNPIDAGASPTGVEGKPTAVTIGNDGRAPLKISAIQVIGTDAGDFTLAGLPALPVTVAPAGTLVFSVRLTASAEGPRTASLNIVSDDPDSPAFAVPMTGMGGTASPSPRASASRTPSQAPSARPTATTTARTIAKPGNDSLSIGVVIGGVVVAFGALVYIRRLRASDEEE